MNDSHTLSWLFYVTTIVAIVCVSYLVSIYLNKHHNKCLHFWGPIVDGRQYCSLCGESRIVECVHDWTIEKSNTVSRGQNTVGEETIYVCSKCSRRKYVRTDVSNRPTIEDIVN